MSTYARIVHASYEDSAAKARDLETASHMLLETYGEMERGGGSPPGGGEVPTR